MAWHLSSAEAASAVALLYAGRRPFVPEMHSLCVHGGRAPTLRIVLT